MACRFAEPLTRFVRDLVAPVVAGQIGGGTPPSIVRVRLRRRTGSSIAQTRWRAEAGRPDRRRARDPATVRGNHSPHPRADPQLQRVLGACRLAGSGTLHTFEIARPAWRQWHLLSRSGEWKQVGGPTREGRGSAAGCEWLVASLSCGRPTRTTGMIARAILREAQCCEEPLLGFALSTPKRPPHQLHRWWERKGSPLRRLRRFGWPSTRQLEFRGRISDGA